MTTSLAAWVAVWGAAAVVGQGGQAEEQQIEAQGFRNIGFGLCTAGGYDRMHGTDRLNHAVAFTWAGPENVRPPFSPLQCASYCAARDDCWGFNQPWTRSSGCVIYTSTVATTATRPYNRAPGNPPGENATMDNTPCYRKNTDVDDVTYVAVVARTTWAEARARCLALDGDLASIPDAVHFHNATGVLSASNRGIGLYEAWIGLSDDGGNNRFQWSDGTGGTDGGFSAWDRSFPQHAARYTSVDSDCTVAMTLNRHSSAVGKWQDRLCTKQGAFYCPLWAPGRPRGGAASTRLIDNNTPNTNQCMHQVLTRSPDANGALFRTGGECSAVYGMTDVDGNANDIDAGFRTCQFVPMANVGFLCGIPTGRTAAPVASTPSPPPSTGPTPWFEHPGHATNFTEMQARMTAAELAVAEMQRRLTATEQTVERLRDALRDAVDAAPAIPPRCSAGSRQDGQCLPTISAVADGVAIVAPYGQINVASASCGVDDLCVAAAFAAGLKEALRTAV